MKTNYIKTLFTIIILSVLFSYCANCDDGVNYEDQIQETNVDSIQVH